MDSLFLRIGGDTAVERIVDSMYAKVLGDSELSPFFDGVDMVRQRAKFRAFMNTLTGAPSQRSGIELRAAHTRAVDAGLSSQHVSSFAAHLRASLAEAGVHETHAHEIMTRIGQLEGDVLGA